MELEPPASVDGAVQGALGRKLRESWDQVVKEDVPEKFLHLLAELKKSEQGDKERGG